jgi:hypothetical protein
MTKPPAYVEVIMRLLQSGVIQSGKVVQVDVGHDDCGMLIGHGICSCKPIVTVRRSAA